MGRPRKIIEGQEEVETEDIAEGDGLIAYIKNGVTRLRYPADEAALIDQGWARK
jgi:hypothetical protein